MARSPPVARLGRAQAVSSLKSFESTNAAVDQLPDRPGPDHGRAVQAWAVGAAQAPLQRALRKVLQSLRSMPVPGGRVEASLRCGGPLSTLFTGVGAYRL